MQKSKGAINIGTQGRSASQHKGGQAYKRHFHFESESRTEEWGNRKNWALWQGQIQIIEGEFIPLYKAKEQCIFV